MKINIIKNHASYPLGVAEVNDDRARYLIAMGVAEGVKQAEKEQETKVVNDMSSANFTNLESFTQDIDKTVPTKTKTKTSIKKSVPKKKKP